MQGILSNNEVVVTQSRAISKLYGQRMFGTMENGALHLNPMEAYYLVEKEKITVSDGKRDLTLSDMAKLTEGQSEFTQRYAVYKDLRDRGYIVKTGFKYGCHFRVYRKSIEEHAEYLVHSLVEKKDLPVDDMMRHVRIAHSVRKKMIFALVDEEHDISYFSIDRITI